MNIGWSMFGYKPIPSVQIHHHQQQQQQQHTQMTPNQRAKAYSYQLQAEGNLATWIRNALLSIRITFLFYKDADEKPVGYWIMITGAILAFAAVYSYVKNIFTIQTLLPNACVNKNTTLNILFAAIGISFGTAITTGIVILFL